jgi:hypothetical protein
MKLSWRQIKFLGIKLTLPQIIVVVQQLNPEQVEQFRLYRAGMAECPKCHKLFSGRAGNSFILHLVDEHDMESSHSMNVVADLYRKLLSRTATLREQAATEGR